MSGWPHRRGGVGEPGVVHFTAAGDFGMELETNAALDLINTTDPDPNIAVGDLSYRATGAEQAWCDFVTSRVGAGFLIGTYGRQYYVDVPQTTPLVRFVMIDADLDFADGTHSYDPGTPRYNWTAAAIDGARTAGVPWVVVGIHKPCHSLGQYTCEIGTGLINMLVSKKVDLVLHGHEHRPTRHRPLHSPRPPPACRPPSMQAPRSTPTAQFSPTHGTSGTVRPAPGSRPTTSTRPQVPTPRR